MINITATNLNRFMNCNGSITMPKFKSDIPEDDEIRQEGIAVHWLIQQVCSGQFISAEDLIDRKSPNNIFITGDMVDHIEDYLNGEGSGGEVEYNTDYETAKWSVSGRADRIKLDGETLLVDDFKYGWSITEPEYNWTLISHAVGYVIQNFKGIIPKRIKFTIYQPRPRHAKGTIRIWEIDYPTLIDYYNQIDRSLSAPKEELKTGKHCYKCPSFINCPAANNAQMNAIDVTETQYSDDMSNEELALMLNLNKRAMELFKTSYSAYNDLALHRLRNGEKIQGYSIENDLSNRQWLDYITPEVLTTMTGKEVTKEVLLSPNQVEKLGVDKSFVKSLTTRQQKGFKLVQIDENAKANKLFNQN